MKTKCTNF